MEILMTKTTYTKNPNTKTTYFVDGVKTEKITQKNYLNIVSEDTRKFFKRLGGSETAQKSYTCSGYLITRLISVSPSKDKKSIYEFKFI
tara:strand:- start:548 stop:814 length:267 start_codon:yes stop_codon:yes gene_type:complete